MKASDTAAARLSPDGDLEAVRAALASRRDDCLARLDDVVSELASLHGLPEEEILRSVRDTIAAEGGAGA